MRILSWTLLLFACVPAQVKADLHPDTLQRVWLDRSRPDTVRLQALYNLIQDHVLYTRPDSALVLADAMYDEAERTSNLKFKAEALNFQGCATYMLGDPEQALRLFQRSLEVRRSHGDSVGVAVANYNMAMIYKDQGDLARAMDCALISLRNEEAGGRKRKVAVTYNLIGVIYMTLEDNDSALESYTKSLALCEQLGDSGQVAVALLNIASLENNTDQNDRALDHMERAIPIFELRGNRRELAAAYRSFGQILESLGRTDEAMDRFEHALGYQQELGDKRGQARTLVNISTLLGRKGQQGPAKEKALQALALARETNDIRGVNEAATSLYAVYKATKRPVEALAMHELMVQMQDSLQSDENERGIIKHRYTYEFEKREALAKADFERQKVATQLELERTRSQRLFLLLGAVSIAVLSVLLVNRYRLKRRLQVAQLRARLSRDLHDDIGSTLSSISILSNVARKRVEVTGDADAAASLGKISDRAQRMMRSMSDIVWSVDPHKDSLEELLVRMREFATSVLESAGIAHTMDFPSEVPVLDLPPQTRNNLYLLFKEAINNVVKHAEAKHVHVQVALHERTLRLEVTDDGIGMESSLPTNGHGGNGLRNMRERAKELKAEFRLEGAKGEGTVVRVSAPLA